MHRMLSRHTIIPIPWFSGKKLDFPVFTAKMYEYGILRQTPVVFRKGSLYLTIKSDICNIKNVTLPLAIHA